VPIKGKPGTWFVCEGTVPRSVASIAAVGIPKEELVKFAAAHYQDLRPGGYDPAARLKDQDTDGVSGEVLYATPGPLLLRDAELQEAVFNAYNEWMVESRATRRLPGGPRADLGIRRGAHNGRWAKAARRRLSRCEHE
jgi:hypothetical protein